MGINTQTQSVPNTTDPGQEAIDKAIQQWNDAKAQEEADRQQLLAMLKRMMDLAKSGHVDQAFAMAQQQVLPGVTQVQGDSMGVLASSNNIASAIQSDLSAMQQDLNKCAQDGDTAAAQDYMSRSANLKSILTNAQTGWIDPSAATNLINSLQKTHDEFGSTPSPDSIAKDMQNWYSNPTKPDPSGGETGQQHIQNIQADETQSNNYVGAQSQTLQAELQFASNTFNQYLNINKDMLQSNQQLMQALVQNQKVQ